MPEIIDLSGKRFNKLLVMFKDPHSFGKGIRWVCQCDCGSTVSVRGDELKRGQKYCSNCTPKGRPSHGLSHLREYFIWAQMKQRCDNPDCDAYKNYGARGIIYCDRWNKFENFFEDMGLRPSKEYTLERKDNNGIYELSNCKWATRKEQARNLRHNRNLEFNGQTKCISEWGEIYGVSHDTIANRIERGWNIEASITTSPNKRYDHRSNN